ncbi:MAG: tetratricopeptide repeat protein [Prevotella sp.]|nr:tetratricopeptide repeat protein [Prevotella sp.]
MNKIYFLLFFLGLASYTQANPKSDAYSQPLEVCSPDSTVKNREYDVLFHEALLQLQKDSHDAAFDLLVRCRELKGDASEVYFFLGICYGRMGNEEEALSCYQQALALEPANTTYLEQLASAYLENNHTTEAIEMVQRLYEADKSRPELLETLFHLYNSEKNYAKAIEMLDRMELIDGPTERTALTKVRLYVELDDADNAVAEARKLSEHHPHDLRYRTLYANTLLVTDHEEQAREVLAEVLAEEPANLSAQQVMRNYYIRRGDEAAADSVNHAILLNPSASVEDKVNQMRQLIIETAQNNGDSTVVFNLFDELLSQPDPSADLAEMKAAYMLLLNMPRDTVAQAFEYVLQLAPNQASARLRLVQQAWEDEDDERIITLCQQARQYNPEEMAFYYYQGMAYYRQQDTDHALEAFQNGISVINEDSRPEIVSDFYAVMGDLLHQKNREAEAFAAYDSCLVWKADNVGCLNNYAYYLSLQNKRLDEAEQMSYRAIKAEPDNATYLDTYAWIMFMQKRYAEARIYIEKALQNDSTPGAVVHEHAGDIFALCNDMDRAMEYWQAAQTEDPKNQLLRRKIKKKKYLKK